MQVQESMQAAVPGLAVKKKDSIEGKGLEELAAQMPGAQPPAEMIADQIPIEKLCESPLNPEKDAKAAKAETKKPAVKAKPKATPAPAGKKK